MILRDLKNGDVFVLALGPSHCFYKQNDNHYRITFGGVERFDFENDTELVRVISSDLERVKMPVLRCLVKDCPNHSNEGMGYILTIEGESQWICSPCYRFLVEPGNNDQRNQVFRNVLSSMIKTMHWLSTR